jgi:hypothetical protein
MARAAAAAGLEYIAITDHTVSLAMTRGSDEKKLRRQMQEIARVQERVAGIRILCGAEVNINKDGTLDIDDETLAALDVVGIAVHSYMNLPRDEMTATYRAGDAEPARRHPLPSDRPEDRDARALRRRHRRHHRAREGDRHRARARRLPRAPRPARRARAARDRRRRADRHRLRRAQREALSLPATLRHRSGPPRLGTGRATC